jgi:hypothetical protein
MYAKGGQLPLGLRRTWASPLPGMRPKTLGVELDPAGAQIVVEAFTLPRAGRSLNQIAEALTSQYGKNFSPSAIHRLLWHRFYAWPPSEELRIVDERLRREALLAVKGRRNVMPRL